MRILKVPAQLSGYNRKADRSASIRFITSKEITVDQMQIIDSYFKSDGWLLFKENEFKNKDVPLDDAPTDTKSAIKRLLAVLYVYYKQTHKKDDPETFYQFRERIIEPFIDHIKNRLN